MYPNLKLQLWKSGIHQNRLARMLSVDETLLSRIVNGFREPSLLLRRQIAATLNAEEAWLFERVDPASSFGGAPDGENDPELKR